MRIRVGTSGFCFEEWRGVFYPPELPGEQMLAWYSGRLPIVELNTTFYRDPDPELFAGWTRQVPRGFRFAVKAPREITHRALAAEIPERVRELLAATAELGEYLDSVLFQLPPAQRYDGRRLDALLSVLPVGLRAAFEFRHPSWFRPSVFAALRERDKALCIADPRAAAPPLVATASWGYLRLARFSYPPEQIDRLARWILAQRWTHATVIFRQAREALSLRHARAMAKRLRQLAHADESRAGVLDSH